MKGMTKRERQVTDEKQILQILDTAMVLHLGLAVNNEPYVVPLNYGYTMEDGKLTLYMHSALQGKKLDMIRENPNVFFEIDCDMEPFGEGDIPCQYGMVYSSILDSDVHTVSCPAVAEMEKILENTYRNINIGLVNELAILCNKMGINIWEVIDAAKTKPYGFQAFYPGPGLGGHCIPLDPYYLTWKAREYEFHTSMIESSMMINDRMPEYTVERAGKILNRYKKALNGSKVLVLGVAYKQDIDDYRESPAVRVIEEFHKTGAVVDFYDPYIPMYREKGQWFEGLTEINTEILNSYDLVCITTAHTNVDYNMVANAGVPVFDCKNVTKNIENKENIEVL